MGVTLAGATPITPAIAGDAFRKGRPMATDSPSSSSRADALVESLFNASIATMEVFAVHIGDRLGYYHALADAGPLTSADLAAQTGTNERYAREWLEQQATAGVLDVSGLSESRIYSLPAECIEVMTDRDSLNYMPPLIRMTVGITEPLDQILQAFRTGGGVPYPDYGVNTREGIADMNRVMFINQLASEWMVAMPEIVARLDDGANPAWVADIGCGSGWSSIALAQGFPHIQVDGYDLDAESITLARRNAIAAGMADRITFHLQDAATVDLATPYDLACAFECIHDMADPVGVLASVRRLVGPGGTVLVADERVADQFTPNGDEVERIMYGFSILHCLPVGMADTPSAATGTVIRSSIMQGYVEAAGYQEFEILPVENLFWRFYRLTA